MLHTTYKWSEWRITGIKFHVYCHGYLKNTMVHTKKDKPEFNTSIRTIHCQCIIQTFNVWREREGAVHADCGVMYLEDRILLILALILCEMFFFYCQWIDEWWVITFIVSACVSLPWLPDWCQTHFYKNLHWSNKLSVDMLRHQRNHYLLIYYRCLRGL